MTPATTVGASSATRKSPPTTRVSQAAAKKPLASGSSVAPKKKVQPPAVKAGRTGKDTGGPAVAAAGTARKAKTTLSKPAARPRVAAGAHAVAAGTAKSAPRRPAVASRPPAGSPRSAAGTKTTKVDTTKTKVETAKVDRKSTTKETVKKPVTSTSRPAKEKKAAAPAPVVKAHKPKSATRRAPAAPAGPYAHDEKFLAEQRQLLGSERAVYLAQASDLKAEADSLAQEREPGDVQFDEESGEGGTVTVDRERDLALSAQALAAVEEIDVALAKIVSGTYGACERCEQPIPKPRLKALPYARLCVACKSGGLSRR